MTPTDLPFQADSIQKMWNASQTQQEFILGIAQCFTGDMDVCVLLVSGDRIDWLRPEKKSTAASEVMDRLARYYGGTNEPTFVAGTPICALDESTESTESHAEFVRLGRFR